MQLNALRTLLALLAVTYAGLAKQSTSVKESGGDAVLFSSQTVRVQGIIKFYDPVGE